MMRFLSRWNPKVEPVIGLYGELVNQYDELVDQLCDLVFIILGWCIFFPW